MNKEPKQVIVIRKDLGMRKGKMCAQAAHASMKAILDELYRIPFGIDDCQINFQMLLKKDDPLTKWIEGIFTKVVVSCDSEEELLALKSRADIYKVRNALIQDAGKTEFHGESTYTALAIGPDYPEKIDKVTGHLKLL
jgi:PTH2 family peptidyl-tRNA hydrolase